jgi:hypothetical protein
VEQENSSFHFLAFLVPPLKVRKSEKNHQKAKKTRDFTPSGTSGTSGTTIIRNTCGLGEICYFYKTIRY